jgi:hypothetical protein
MDQCDYMSGVCFTLAVGSVLWGCKSLTDLDKDKSCLDIYMGTLTSFAVFSSFSMCWYVIGNR